MGAYSVYQVSSLHHGSCCLTNWIFRYLELRGVLLSIMCREDPVNCTLFIEHASFIMCGILIKILR